MSVKLFIPPSFLPSSHRRRLLVILEFSPPAPSSRPRVCKREAFSTLLTLDSLSLLSLSSPPLSPPVSPLSHRIHVPVLEPGVSRLRVPVHEAQESDGLKNTLGITFTTGLRLTRKDILPHLSPLPADVLRPPDEPGLVVDLDGLRLLALPDLVPHLALGDPPVLGPVDLGQDQLCPVDPWDDGSAQEPPVGHLVRGVRVGSASELELAQEGQNLLTKLWFYAQVYKNSF